MQLKAIAGYDSLTSDDKVIMVSRHTPFPYCVVRQEPRRNTAGLQMDDQPADAAMHTETAT